MFRKIASVLCAAAFCVAAGAPGVSAATPDGVAWHCDRATEGVVASDSSHLASHSTQTLCTIRPLKTQWWVEVQVLENGVWTIAAPRTYSGWMTPGATGYYSWPIKFYCFNQTSGPLYTYRAYGGQDSYAPDLTYSPAVWHYASYGPSSNHRC